jgi:hypothetical protein
MPLVGRRRPLLRAAAVGTGAYMAGQHAQRRAQEEQYQDQQIAALQDQQYAQPQYAAPPPPAGPPANYIDQLKELGQLREQGVLTDAEFAEQKARLLGG